MLRRILDDARRDLVRDLHRHLDDLRVALVRGGAPEEHQKALARSIATLDEMFLLVVAGEFNAGKSAVVNALLGERVVEEGVTPTTSRIHVLKHGPERRRTPSGGGYEETTLPVPLLREMNVVDTPGTNAVVEGHEALARDFVPRSDLVLFVTSADRPFTASERAFLEAIRSWGKKVIVAVNKTDILDDPADVRKVVDFVREKTKALLGRRPEVFAVSARRAQKVKAGAAPDPHADGFAELEAYVTRTLDDAARVRLKLQNPIGVGLRVLEEGAATAAAALAVLGRDAAALREVEGQLSLVREDAVRDLRARLADVEKPLVDLQARGEELLEETLGPAKVLALLDARATRAAFEKGTADVVPAVEKRADGLADAVSAGASRLWPAVVERLAPRQADRPGRLPPLPTSAPPIDPSRLRAALRRDISRVLEGDGHRAEARRIGDSARRTAATTLGLLGLAAGLVAFSILVPEQASMRLGGLGAALAVAGGGLWLLPGHRRSETARFADRVGSMRRRLVPALRTTLEAELDRARQHARDAIEPMARFVGTEDERLRGHEQELARLKDGLETLRSRAEGLR